MITVVTVFAALEALLIVLIVGDFASTFFYHVPQHVWFKLHLRTHHDRRRSYWDHAVISLDPAVMLDGFLGAIPYMVLAAACWRISPVGAILGLVLGQLHVWWRHTTDLGWKTPPWAARLTRPLALVLPEDHDGHHRNPETEFGDIFRIYDAPARALIAHLRAISRSTRRRKAAIRSAVRRAAGRPAARRKGPLPSPGRG
ncbi:MAG: sterol desaturase family protein [Candidatus Eremiobacteraeota bacterium]|nr:sterol desaturase family protein [Candidatus Eremiobacteraeota bacterium]MBV8356243.1 sterol desaturase family protein [Candidatus Eremiobacteraeota bacterium]